MTKRQKALRRRRIFLICCAVGLIIAILAVTGIVVLIKKALSGEGGSTDSTPQSSVSEINSSSDVSSDTQSSNKTYSAPANAPDLDPYYSRLLLVNGEYPLPGDYNYGADLITIDAKYHNGQLDQINKDIWPYMKAMIEAAWADGVKLFVWSPYRSYEIQNMLFQKQVQRCIDAGTPADKAEDEAATVVARPGTSEHNTGLCADFNMASDAFETTPMYTWMSEHAADYGFILRYPKDATDKTGVIYESWHWRFVGISTAHEINDLGITLEEYVKLKKLDPQSELDTQVP